MRTIVNIAATGAARDCGEAAGKPVFCGRSGKTIGAEAVIAAEQAEEFWEDLLANIEERRVIPIVGPELVAFDRDGTRTTLNRLVAEKLTEKLRIPSQGLPEGFGLNEVVCAHLAARGRREEVYPKIRAIVRETPLAPPEALRRLARIPAFDLYVTLGFDSLLVDAVNAERFGGQARTEHLGYSPAKPQDLPAERDKLANPVVYSLLGKLSVAPDYVASDEDTLEFMCALQTERRPHLLFDELHNNNLLIIGCAFPDWLARFFIRISKSRQLSAQRGESEILVDRIASSDANLVLFLEHFSYATKIAPMDADGFVAELERRWFERHRGWQPPAAAPAPAAAAPAKAALPGHGAHGAPALPDMAPGSIFISYAKEDLAAVQALQKALESLGVDVWFDKDRLEAGDLYDQKIKRNIRSCSFFMPVISRTTERRLEGYFRREWRLADERTMGIADNMPFILPVVVDDTAEYSDNVPESFRRAQWSRLAEGRATPEFETRLVRLVREARKRDVGLS